MGRRWRTDLDWIIPLAVGLTLLTFIYPPLRQKVSPLALLAIALVGMFSVGFLIFRLLRQGGKPLANYRAYDLQTLEPIQPSVPTQPLASSAPTQRVEEVPTLKAAEPMSFIEQLHSIDWFQFEKLVAIVYAKLGYNVKPIGGANPDGGIDLVLEKEGVRTGVQCKHWKDRDVGVQALREFLGALSDAGLKHGKFITIGDYTEEAKQFAQRRGIEAINQDALIALLESANASLDPKVLAFLKDTTKYCPRCERVMVVRTAMKGANPGSKFWGCSNYPRCDFTMPFS